MNGKLNCSSYTSLFLFKVTLKIGMWVSKIHFSFFTEIENTKSGTLKYDFNETKTETKSYLLNVNLVTKPGYQAEHA